MRLNSFNAFSTAPKQHWPSEPFVVIGAVFYATLPKFQTLEIMLKTK